jgi:hypothetical protein
MTLAPQPDPCSTTHRRTAPQFNLAQKESPGARTGPQPPPPHPPQPPVRNQQTAVGNLRGQQRWAARVGHNRPSGAFPPHQAPPPHARFTPQQEANAPHIPNFNPKLPALSAKVPIRHSKTRPRTALAVRPPRDHFGNAAQSPHRPPPTPVRRVHPTARSKRLQDRNSNRFAWPVSTDGSPLLRSIKQRSASPSDLPPPNRPDPSRPRKHTLTRHSQKQNSPEPNQPRPPPQRSRPCSAPGGIPPPGRAATFQAPPTDPCASPSPRSRFDPDQP